MISTIRNFVKAAVCLSVALLGCALPAVSLAQQAQTDSPVVYDESKLAITVTSKQPVFVLKLVSNPTTGYVWLLKNYDKSLLVPVKHEYQAPNTKLIGAPGFDMWTFRVKPDAFTVPQRTSILMTYARPWEADNSGKNLEFVVTTQAG